MIRRHELLVMLQSHPFDVLIIGGGIVGAGIARDAAMRGLRVALIEQGDFASGTSSKTSKLIHGGLRYLEHGRLRLVFESLRERHILRTIAPAYVHPRSLLLPVYAGDRRPRWQIDVGLWLYDGLAAGRNIRRHRMLFPTRALKLEPGLRADGLRGAGWYTDCQMDDARVCLINILQAMSFGAVCGNYLRLQALLKANGRLVGGSVEDVVSGRSIGIEAKVVVNAAGPWGDGIRRLSDAAAGRRLAPTKGIHLILPRVTQEALFVQARADGRMFFILPWGDDYSLIGTTETAVSGALESLAASRDEVDYLLTEVNRLVPGRRLDEDDVVATYAGARPLLAFSGSSTQASREHRIEVDRYGLISVMGGKFTTYRRMAQQVVDLIAARRAGTRERCLTDQVSLLEAVHPVTLERWRDLVRMVTPDLLARCLTRYGAGTFQLLRLLDREPSLASAVCPHHDDLEAELVYALQEELACTMTDVLARRTRIAWSSCQGLDLLSRLGELMQQYVGLSSAEVTQQVQQYHEFLARGLAFRRSHTPSETVPSSADGCSVEIV